MHINTHILPEMPGTKKVSDFGFKKKFEIFAYT
jgi:hypothetical protein